MIVLIINSFIELYGIHKKRYWIIPFSCICKFSAMVYIIVHIYITSGNNYLLAGMSWFYLFYITKIKLVSKSKEEKKIAPKKTTEEITKPELDQVWAAFNKN